MIDNDDSDDIGGEDPGHEEDYSDGRPFIPEQIVRLTKDLKDASIRLSDREARFLVDCYYMMQENRKRAANQERALGTTGEPHLVLSWFAEQSKVLEKQVGRALDGYTQNHMMGEWMRGIFGIGPILSAGLLANIYMGMWCTYCRGRDPEHCKRRQASKFYTGPKHEFLACRSLPTAGHIFQFAGIAGDGQHVWERGEIRPWNATLKTLCWKIGDSFCKQSNKPKCYYGPFYRQRKEQEIAYNEAGKFAHIAKAKIDAKLSKKERSYHDKGKLSPGHLDLRARRYATKLFIYHLHAEWYFRVFGEPPPKPYPLEFGGHVHEIPPPPR